MSLTDILLLVVIVLLLLGFATMPVLAILYRKKQEGALTKTVIEQDPSWMAASSEAVQHQKEAAHSGSPAMSSFQVDIEDDFRPVDPSLDLPDGSNAPAKSNGKPH